MYRQSEKNFLSSNISPTSLYNVVNFGPLAAEIVSLVCGTPANFNGFRVLAALLHDILLVGVSQTAALNRGRYLYSAGRPSRWALVYSSSFGVVEARALKYLLCRPSIASNDKFPQIGMLHMTAFLKLREGFLTGEILDTVHKLIVRILIVTNHCIPQNGRINLTESFSDTDRRAVALVLYNAVEFVLYTRCYHNTDKQSDGLASASSNETVTDA